ncbi:MAG: tungstate transport system permease protein [Gammaproteobacteria bacterium]|jgi:tungstate transport system permease protein
MTELWQAAVLAAGMLRDLNSDLVEVIVLSLRVSLSAVTIAALVGFPLGALLALMRFPGRRIAIVTLNVLMGLPPVVVGLLVYLMLSRSGPLGVFGLLFTPGAMIVAQVVLALPIIASLTRQVLEGLWGEYHQTFRSLGASRMQSVAAVLWDGRFQLVTALLAGFGRVTAEVGAVMIVGGNIDHVTRVMTTAIALEASKGDLPVALGLGIVLLMLSLGINILAYGLQVLGESRSAL